MKNRTITIVDEDKKFLGELEGILTANGYSPVVVNDAQLALESAVRNKPDVILLELRMRHLNGFELANEISRRFESERIPIIAMSSVIRNDFFPLMNMCGIKKCIKKPFSPLDIISAIEEVISSNSG